MQAHSKPACPECGSSDAKPISVQYAYLNNPPQKEDQPVSIVTVFLCPCGATFSQTTRQNNRGTPPASRP